MPESLDASASSATPPVTLLRSFELKVIERLLGTEPDPTKRRLYRAFEEEDWPEDLQGAEFLHRGLARLLWEGGGTEEAADTVRKALQTGKLRAAVVLPHGLLWELGGYRFQGEDSRWLWWRARAEVKVTSGPRLGCYEGDIYLTSAQALVGPLEAANPEPTPLQPDWWPKAGQTQFNWATSPAVEDEAERRLKAAGVTLTEAAKSRAMEAMAGEAGVAWTASSIEASRRKAR